MIPIDSLILKNAADLSRGDFATIFEFGVSGFVGTGAEGELLIAALHNDAWLCHDVADLPGAAYAVTGWRLDVDHESAVKLAMMDHSNGAWCIQRGALSIQAKFPRGFGRPAVNVRDHESELSAGIAFPNWKVVLPTSEGVLELFYFNMTDPTEAQV